MKGTADLERIGDKERRAIGRGRIGIIPIGTIGKTWECKSCWALF